MYSSLCLPATHSQSWERGSCSRQVGINAVDIRRQGVGGEWERAHVRAARERSVWNMESVLCDDSWGDCGPENGR